MEGQCKCVFVYTNPNTLEGSILFFYEQTDFKIENPSILIDWIMESAAHEDVDISFINYIITDDEYLLDINKKHLNHDYFTDIITFPYQEGNHIEADIFVSIDRVRDNAMNLNIDFHEELRRVMIHGVLHLIGYNDKTEIQKKIMREKENFYLGRFSKGI